jgi:hypothetical protein
MSNYSSTTAAVSIVVLEGLVVALITGGTDLAVRMGEMSVVDASESYDEDYFVVGGGTSNTDLQYTWTCNVVGPTPSPSCSDAVLFSSSSSPLGNKISVSPLDVTDDSLVSTVCQFTVVVSSGNRISSSSVLVTIKDSVAPVISLTSASLVSVNVDQKIRVSGSISLFVQCDALWAVSGDSSLNLTKTALTPVSQLVTGSRDLNLVISAGSLVGGFSYTFSLSCGGTVASIIIVTNGPPSAGNFTVLPLSGVELQTSFQFSASD